MAGLNDINPTNPLGSELLSLGDDRIRAVVAKIIECIGAEHSLLGYHKLPCGTLAARPSFGNRGRLYVLETAGLAAELQYDSGTAWVTLTRNQIGDATAGGLAAHRAAIPIDHPDGSVQHMAIAAGNILAKHLNGSIPDDLRSLAGLVNGSLLPVDMHYHAVGGSGGVVYAPPATNPDIKTIPPGVSLLKIHMWGAGAGGTSYPLSPFHIDGPDWCHANKPPGGGGGAYTSGMIKVVPGEQYSIKVGHGGIGGTSGLWGSDGGDSWIKKVGETESKAFASGGKGIPPIQRYSVDDGTNVTWYGTCPGAEGGRGLDAEPGDIISSGRGATCFIRLSGAFMGGWRFSITFTDVGALSGGGGAVPGGGGNAGNAEHPDGYPGNDGKFWMTMS